MFITHIRILRAVLKITWLAGTLSVLVLAMLPHALAYAGRDLYTVRGGSMEPAIPIGSAVIVKHVDPRQVKTGDVITFKASNGTVVTHRVIGIPAVDGVSFQTKGDASAAADLMVVPGEAVVGSVEYVLPAAGLAMTMLSSTMGAVTAISLLGGLLLALWFVDDLVATLRRSSNGRTAAAEPAK